MPQQHGLRRKHGPVALPPHDSPFNKPNTPFDKRRAWAPPDDDNLLSKRQDVFDLAALGPGGATPLFMGASSPSNPLTSTVCYRGGPLRPK